MRISKTFAKMKKSAASAANSTLSWLGALGTLFAALFGGFGRWLHSALFGTPLPPVIDDAQAERVVERHMPADDVDALERQVAAELAAMRAQREMPLIDPREPEEQAWYRIVAPNGTTESYACGTAREAQRWYEWSGDGYRTEQVLDQGRLMQLGMLASLEGAHIKGAPIKRLSDEIDEWRSERTCGN